MVTPHHHVPDWVHRHPHEPNPAPPGEDSSFSLILPNGATHLLSVEELQKLSWSEIENCYIVSTGHGTSGPFRFGGVRLLTVINSFLPADQPWTYVDVHSSDGFGTRLQAAELQHELPERASLLAWQLDNSPLTRKQGLVRLIVPSETDDALKQVKWISQIVLVNQNPAHQNPARK